MGIPFIFVIITMVTVAFNIYLRSIKQESQMENTAKLLDADYKANYASKKPIPDELYLTINLDCFPLRDYPDGTKYMRVRSKQNDVSVLAHEKMIYLSEPISNTALKERYGVSNWELIVLYEENYNRFIHALLEWADALIANGSDHDAETVLKLAIEYNCDRSQGFCMLADVLARRSDSGGLTRLRESVSNSGIFKGNPVVKTKIIAYIESVEQGKTAPQEPSESARG